MSSAAGEATQAPTQPDIMGRLNEEVITQQASQGSQTSQIGIKDSTGEAHVDGHDDGKGGATTAAAMSDFDDGKPPRLVLKTVDEELEEEAASALFNLAQGREVVSRHGSLIDDEQVSDLTFVTDATARWRISHPPSFTGQHAQPRGRRGARSGRGRRGRLRQLVAEHRAEPG